MSNRKSKHVINRNVSPAKLFDRVRISIFDSTRRNAPIIIFTIEIRAKNLHIFNCVKDDSEKEVLCDFRSYSWWEINLRVKTHFHEDSAGQASSSSVVRLLEFCHWLDLLIVTLSLLEVVRTPGGTYAVHHVNGGNYFQIWKRYQQYTVSILQKQLIFQKAEILWNIYLPQNGKIVHSVWR